MSFIFPSPRSSTMKTPSPRDLRLQTLPVSRPGTTTGAFQHHLGSVVMRTASRTPKDGA